MDNLIKGILLGNGVDPPDACLHSFAEHFQGAINTEWFSKDACFEAIFYKDNIEHIAVFEGNGELREYKKYLSAELLPELIKQYLEQKGEIMNVVLINKGSSINYEAIVRDTDLKRMMVLFNDQGDVMQERNL